MRESITELAEKCKKYKLADAEIVNIINIRPSSAVEIDPIIEQCEKRLGESVEELVELVAEVCPTPALTEPDEAAGQDTKNFQMGNKWTLIDST
ncbi:DNA-directed RNA polymerase III subunit rpc9 like [Actinidia chinensis var. chinensis]|uniref:DNA-directed RNA polymerase III subunit RPC9 n=1 Tax=Actinidia chinensis var. chinensis TaxID=1590841 RepID=A0A2R6RUY8_ACTCC|nr:DNA-directed RNA polymerase III subunit rpc9 like [Actinidia chinensis var. chinensis]